MTSYETMSSPGVERGRFKGWHALLWFLGFFGFMFVVNGIFLWTAITTFPGEDVEKSYLTGIDYNQEIARRTHQENAGWSAEIGTSGQLPHRTIHVRLIQKDGSVLATSGTVLLLRHPADRNLDRELELAPASAGVQTASLEGVGPGRWTVQISADVDPETDGYEFKASREMIVP